MKKILFVDDDASIIACYTDLFQMLGFEVLTTATADETITLYEKQRDFFAVVIDVGLEEKSGAELADCIKQKHPSQAIILTSGFSVEMLSASDAGYLQKYPDISFITKPFTSDALLKLLNN